MNDKPKVLLLVGGASPEREVSKMSGKGVYVALLKLSYAVTVIDPAYGTNQPDDVNLFFNEKDFSAVSPKNYLSAINLPVFENSDVVFSVLHGKWGEDGVMQSLLELKGLKYTGSKVLASAAAMDKDLSKTVFQQNKIPTAKWLTVNKFSFKEDELINQIKQSVGFPCVVKPNDQGSTVGLTVVDKTEQIKDSLELAFKFSDKVMIEEFIDGRELTVAILERSALPVLEIIPKSGLYDYRSKYTSGMSEYIVPAELPENTFNETGMLALKAFDAIGCDTYARVDFKYRDGETPYCLEINTLPGMTPLSLVPKMAKAVGISFEELIDRIIKNTL